MPKKMESNCTKDTQFQNRFEEGIRNPETILQSLA